MTSTRPYLIRAFYDWIVDNHCTPHLVVNVHATHVDVPNEYVENGQIVLNIALSAVSAFKLGEEAIEFQARFGGRVRSVYVPHRAVLAIYARENGRGMVFAEEEDEPLEPPPALQAHGAPQGLAQKPKVQTKKRGTHLTLVK